MRVLLLYFGLISLLYAMPVDIEEEDGYELQRLSVAVIVKIEGRAKVLPKASIKKHKANPGDALFEGDRLITSLDSKVLVELEDSSKLILNANSELSFIDTKRLDQASGEVYYNIKTRKGVRGLQVKTPFSIMGVKGTEFIVNAQGGGQIALKEGRLGIESLKEEFELHRKKLMAEFEKYKEEQSSGFEAYKAEMEGDIVSYVKAFDLESGKVLHFGDARACVKECERQVKEKELSKEIQKRFQMYKAILAE